MKQTWNRGRVGRLLIGAALAGLLVPNLLAGAPSVVRAADYAVPSFDIADDDTSEFDPRVSGNLVVYTEHDAGKYNVFVKNLETDDTDQVNEEDDFARTPDIDGDTIVFMQDDGGDPNIYGYDISDEDHFEIDTGTGGQYNPAISGNRVVYEDNSGGDSDIKGYDIAEDDDFDVIERSGEQVLPAIDGDLVAWVDYRDASEPDIYARDLGSGDTFQVSFSGNAESVAVSGDKIVYGTQDFEIFVYDRAEDARHRLNQEDDDERYSPRIDGDIVVWYDYRDDDQGDIFGFDLANDQEFIVDNQGDGQSTPDIDGNTIVWSDESGNGNVRGGTLEITGVETPTEEEVETPTVEEGPVNIPAPLAYSCTGKTIFASGFCIDNPTIANFYEGRGGRDTFGDPISRTFIFRGSAVQIFQRHIIEIGPDGAARLPNLLDPGLMPVNSINFSTYPAVDESVKSQTPPASDLPALLSFIQQKAPENFNGQPVRFFSTFSGFVTCQDAFPNGGCIEGLIPGFNLEVVGAVTSNPAPDPNNPNFIYQRFQRAILHYDANCQCTQALLLASYFADVIKGTAPADLMAAMAGTPFISQYNNAMPGGLNRPAQLTNTNMQNAFEKP